MLRDLEYIATRAGFSLQLDVVVGNAAKEILARAAQFPADIVVLGHSRRTRFDWLGGQSVMGLVLARADCAVLLPPAA